LKVLLSFILRELCSGMGALHWRQGGAGRARHGQRDARRNAKHCLHDCVAFE
jgi:ribosomal protein L4